MLWLSLLFSLQAVSAGWCVYIFELTFGLCMAKAEVGGKREGGAHLLLIAPPLYVVDLFQH